jgi:hypothetical protein
MALQAVMVLSDLTHWIPHKCFSSDGPQANTWIHVLTELTATTKGLFSLVILANKLKCART